MNDAYDGFLGYVNDEDPDPKNLKECIDRFINLSKEDQNIYFAMFENGTDYTEKKDEFGKIVPYTMKDWITIAIEKIKGLSKEECTNYAIGKSIDNINSIKISSDKNLEVHFEDLPQDIYNEIVKLYQSYIKNNRYTIIDRVLYADDKKNIIKIELANGAVIQFDVRPVTNLKNENIKEEQSVIYNYTDSTHLSWDETFMEIAEVMAKRSKDPSTKVGACIVKDHKILSTGYNGMPKVYNTLNNNDSLYSWEKSDSDPLKNKYNFVVHAELNSILNSGKNLEGATLYTTSYPCNECAKAIVQCGISKVIYKNDRSELIFDLAKHIFKTSGIEVVKYE